MKRNAFTLIELIMVIVIIGVLAAVAVPKYKNLQQNAEVKAAIKTTIDTASSAASAAVNQADLEENATYTLSDLVNVTGKGWSYNSADQNGSYSYTTAGGRVSFIRLNTDTREVYYEMDCDKFVNSRSKEKCATDLNVTLVVGADINKTISY